MTLLEETVGRITTLSPAPEIAKRVQDRWNSLTKPRGSLGRLETEILRLANVQGAPTPSLDRAAIYVICGDHGIAEEGVSPYPQAVTREMMKNFVRGGAAISVLCRNAGIETIIVDAGVCGPKIDGVLDRRIAEGTRSFLRGPAMDSTQTRAALETGIQLATEAASQFDIVGLGEMGIGNSASASALVSAYLDISPDLSVGRGAGLDDAGLSRKRDIVARALSRRKGELNTMNPVEVLANFGGFEIATMAGFLLGAAANNLPSVVDGFISTSAFVAARQICPAVAEYTFFGHRSAESGHLPALISIGKAPLLDLGLRLGEGTGAAMAISVLRTGLHLYREMATFAEASVSDRSPDSGGAN
jgi:nicotinate-nucleotide--dimethylbenzimidazole phosphoribosyltransferase